MYNTYPKLGAFEAVEYDDRYEVRIVMPGYSEDEIQVRELNAGEFFVKAKRKKNDDGGEVIAKGINFPVYEEKFRVGYQYVGNITDAILENGILRIIIEKKEDHIRNVPVKKNND